MAMPYPTHGIGRVCARVCVPALKRPKPRHQIFRRTLTVSPGLLFQRNLSENTNTVTLARSIVALSDVSQKAGSIERDFVWTII